jgi:hypothetical protein
MLMPPGEFRLGIVNARDLQAGFAAIPELAKSLPRPRTHAALNKFDEI